MAGIIEALQHGPGIAPIDPADRGGGDLEAEQLDERQAQMAGDQPAQHVGVRDQRDAFAGAYPGELSQMSDYAGGGLAHGLAIGAARPVAARVPFLPERIGPEFREIPPGPGAEINLVERIDGLDRHTGASGDRVRRLMRALARACLHQIQPFGGEALAKKLRLLPSMRGEVHAVESPCQAATEIGMRRMADEKENACQNRALAGSKLSFSNGGRRGSFPLGASGSSLERVEKLLVEPLNPAEEQRPHH